MTSSEEIEAIHSIADDAAASGDWKTLKLISDYFRSRALGIQYRMRGLIADALVEESDAEHYADLLRERR